VKLASPDSGPHHVLPVRVARTVTSALSTWFASSRNVFLGWVVCGPATVTVQVAVATVQLSGRPGLRRRGR
jgi:hypothetical protein